MLIEKQIHVHKELTELGEGAIGALEKLLPALADGAGIDDIMVIFDAIRTDVLPALDGAREIVGEVSSNHPATAATAGYLGFKLLEAILK